MSIVEHIAVTPIMPKMCLIHYALNDAKILQGILYIEYKIT